MKHTFTNKLTNAIEPAVPTSVWGYKGCAGKGGKTQNVTIINKKETNDRDN